MGTIFIIGFSLCSVFALLTWLTYPRVSVSEKGPLAGQTVQAELTAGDKRQREEGVDKDTRHLEAVNSHS